MDSHDLIKTFADTTADEMEERDFGTSTRGNDLVTFNAAWFRQQSSGPSIVHLELVRKTENGDQTLEDELTVAAGSDAAQVLGDKARALLER